MIPAQYMGLLPHVTPNDGGLGDELDSLRAARRADRVRAEDMARSDAQTATKDARHALESDRDFDLKKESIEGKNRYYDNKLNGDQNKRVNMLMDAYRKASGSGDQRQMDMIRQELKRVAGYSVDDGSATEGEPVNAPAPAAPASPPLPGSEMRSLPDMSTPEAPQSAAPAPGKAPRGRGAPAWLTQYMGGTLPSGGGGDTPSETEANSQLAAEGVGIKSAPLPGQAMAGPMIASPAPKPKPAASGRFAIRDKEGNIVNIYDSSSSDTEEQTRVKEAMAPMVAMATTPEEKAAASQAQELAASFVKTMPPDQAVKLALDHVKSDMGQYKKHAVPGQGGGGGGGAGLPSKQQMAYSAKMDEQTNKIIDDVSRDDKFGAVTDAQGAIDRGFGLVHGSRSGLTDVLAVKELVKEMSGKAASDKEFSSIVDAGGALSRVERAINNVADGGKMPDGLMKDLERVLNNSQNVLNQRREAAGKRAASRVRSSNSYANEEDRSKQAELVMHYYTGHGDASAKPAAKDGAKPPPAGQGAPAPAAGDDRKQKALERARKLLGQ